MISNDFPISEVKGYHRFQGSDMWMFYEVFLSEQKKINISQESCVHMKCTIALFLLGQLNLALIFACFSFLRYLIVINWS